MSIIPRIRAQVVVGLALTFVTIPGNLGINTEPNQSTTGGSSTLASPASHIVPRQPNSISQVSLHQVYLTTRWNRLRATKAAALLGRRLSWPPLSTHLPRIRQQAEVAQANFYKYRSILFWKQASSLRSNIRMKHYPFRPDLARSAADFSYQSLQVAKKQVLTLSRQWKDRISWMNHDPVRAAHYAEWYWMLGDGRHSGPLVSCTGSEGGLGKPVWNGPNGGVVDLNPYNGKPLGAGSDAYGWLQIMPSTYQRFASSAGLRLHMVRSVFGPMFAGWNVPYDHFMAGGWAFSHGHVGEWAGSGCHL